MRVTPFFVLSKYAMSLSVCLGYGFLSYQPAAQAQTRERAACFNEPNGRVNFRGEVFIPNTVITGHAMNALFYPELRYKRMVPPPEEALFPPSSRIRLVAGTNAPQVDVTLLGQYTWLGSFTTPFGVTRWRGTTNATGSVPCNPPPAGQPGGSGASGGSGGDIPCTGYGGGNCCSCTGADYGATENLIGQGTVNPDPAQYAQAAESKVDPENLLALGVWQGTTWAEKGIN